MYKLKVDKEDTLLCLIRIVNKHFIRNSNLRNRNLTTMKNTNVTPVKRSSGRIRGKKPSSLRVIARKTCPDENGYKYRTVIDLTDDNEVKEYIERLDFIDEVIDLTD